MNINKLRRLAKGKIRKARKRTNNFEKRLQLSEIYPTEEEARKHAQHFKDMGWGGTYHRTLNGWGVYYELYP